MQKKASLLVNNRDADAGAKTACFQMGLSWEDCRPKMSLGNIHQSRATTFFNGEHKATALFGDAQVAFRPKFRETLTEIFSVSGPIPARHFPTLPLQLSGGE